jgi:hypothetical protein
MTVRRGGFFLTGVHLAFFPVEHFLGWSCGVSYYPYCFFFCINTAGIRLATYPH